MLLAVGEFKSRATSDIDGLIADLQDLTDRYGDDERHAWASSLPKIAKLFSASSFDHLHLYFGDKGSLALEYQLPAASSWCDMVLLGRKGDKPGAVIIELKDWQTRADRPGLAQGLIERQGRQVLHPADQVRGYTEYCRRFHSTVQDYSAAVYGCVVFTADPWIDPYRQAPNAGLVSDYPCFSLSERDVGEALPRYFGEKICEPATDFAAAFEKGSYRQERGFVGQIGAQIRDRANSPFVLLDNQRNAFAMCDALIRHSIPRDGAPLEKTVIIVEGPPGSGKSVIAAKLWATSAVDPDRREGDVVLTTTSASQNSNWSRLFADVGDDEAAPGVVKKATQYTPLTTHALGRLRREYGDDFLSHAGQWRENMGWLRAMRPASAFHDGSGDNAYLVSIVDEAHALINPEHREGRGQFGFVVTLGPQAYHIVRASVVSVFLLDPEQGFRDRENTSPDEIKAWARELGVKSIETVSLAGSQFRCAGSKEYVDWVEAVLRGDSLRETRQRARAWRPEGSVSGEPGNLKQPELRAAEPATVYEFPSSRHRHAGMDFRVFADPFQLEAALRERAAAKDKVRLLASYARDWKTKNFADPHEVAGHEQDFHEPITAADGKPRFWSRVWNFVPGGDYTYFVQGRTGARIHDDPLCEVGCPYAVRGFDFDYVGILWLGDLKWRNSAWTVDPEHVFETGIDSTKRAAQREVDPQGPAHQRLLRAVAQGYRILLTRPLKGLYVWFEDAETREYVSASLAWAPGEGVLVPRQVTKS